MKVLEVNCQPVVMVEPSGGCYEDGGAMPLCDEEGVSYSNPLRIPLHLDQKLPL